jgi:peptide chain release factor subunit 1
MISKHDLERLLNRPEGEHPVLSLFLDMSVNSDNKRTHQVFLNQRRAQFDELDSDRENRHHEAIGRAFARIQSWLDEEFAEENRGVVIYLEVGGDWFEALQFPVPVTNRFVIAERPYISPLAEVIQTYHHQGVVLLDREHVRILSVYLGTLLDEIEVHGKPYPTPNDVQAGGFSQQRFQRRKREEMKHFFKEFAKEIDEFVRRYKPEDLVILGTDENVARFREFLSEKARDMIVYTGPMGVDETASEILLRLQPHLDAERKRESDELLELLRERVKEDYLATAGFQGTLSALQEGKVDTLVIAQNQDDRTGARCTQCSYVFPREVETCPFDGAETVGGVNVVEEVIRMAEAQGAEIEFVPATEVQDLRGVGALLRF